MRPDLAHGVGSEVAVNRLAGTAPSASGDDEQWAPLSDLMAALMLIFMFIAILPMRDVVESDEKDRVMCSEIWSSLDRKFRHEFDDWDVMLLDDLTIRFRNPELLFTFGTADLKPRFQGILRSFWPDYIDIIKGHAETDIVKEIQIEGHTSSEWNGPLEGAYIGNMKLSQDRAISTLQFVLDLPLESGLNDWAKPFITANGLSFSKVVRDQSSGKEDFERSKRVEFRLITTACQRAGIYDRASDLEKAHANPH